MATRKTTGKRAKPAASGTENDQPEFTVPADKHQLVVKAQREFIGALAGRVENDEPIHRAAERRLIAGILRAWARQIPDALPHARGRTARIEPGYAAIHFAWLVNGEGRTKSAATAELAGIYGVSPEAVADAVAKFEEPAMRLVPKKPALRASS